MIVVVVVVVGGEEALPVGDCGLPGSWYSRMLPPSEKMEAVSGREWMAGSRHDVK